MLQGVGYDGVVFLKERKNCKNYHTSIYLLIFLTYIT